MADAAVNPTGNPARVNVSVVVITLNEERNLFDCLESARWADEIIVVDAESGDETLRIARGFTDRVFVRPWPGFGAQKNFGVSHNAIINE